MGSARRALVVEDDRQVCQRGIPGARQVTAQKGCAVHRRGDAALARGLLAEERVGALAPVASTPEADDPF